ncbi:hypothetical protein D0865_09331 [Hortaea werneckii]|uniref:Cytochrome P450 n=1 Tax=Hortaea werneckii TaxID=91943 RepID=A0A3M7C2K0_HORWE|nr:hypothetical protein D0865_09331 [Hortaea werneckii]
MILNFIDRIWTPTLLYGSIAYAILKFAGDAHPTIPYGVVGVIAIYYLNLFVTAAVREIQLDQLGKRAPSRRTWTPWNVQLLFHALYLFSKNRNHEWWWGNFRTSGNKNLPYTVEAITVGERIVFTADEENIKAILATQFQDYGKGPRFRQEWKDFLGLSIFTTDGELWHNSRQLLRPQFIKDRVSDLNTFENHVQVMLPMFAGRKPGDAVRVDDLFFRFTLDAATDFILGKSVDSLHNGQAEFARAFAVVQNVQSTMARAGPLQGWIPKKAYYEGLAVLNRFVGTYIDRALELPPEELEKRTKSDHGYTFLHALAGYTRDREVLRDQLVAVLLAGRDTTAVTLSWLFYELSKHPEVVRKLRQEIFNYVGLDKTPTYDNLKSMKYLQHTLNETLRLYPVVPFNVRVALKDTTLPHGGGPNGDEPIAVLKDTPIGYSTLVMQRREDVYPAASSGFPHYETFAPERWDGWTPKSWTYIPFNGGPRICIGQQFALTEMAYVVVRILQTYDRLECHTPDFPGLKADITLSPATGVKVAFSAGEKQ